jgi:hypothetical protein
MIDPMAGLDDGPGMASEENTKEVFDSMTLQRNLQRVDKIRSVMGIASGCAAGIVGFTGLEGFGTSIRLFCFILGVPGFRVTLPVLKWSFYVCVCLQLAFYYFILQCLCFFGRSN